jgi:hypothetical protein
MNIRILLADDHALVRAGLRALIKEMPGIDVVGEAEDGGEALRLIGELHPDVALVDISMPNLNGIEVAARVASDHPRTRVVMLSLSWPGRPVTSSRTPTRVSSSKPSAASRAARTGSARPSPSLWSMPSCAATNPLAVLSRSCHRASARSCS